MAFSDLLPTRRRTAGRRTSDLDPISSLREEMNSVFDSFLHGFMPSTYREGETHFEKFTPNIDISETDKKIKVTAELPGLEEKDITVSLEENYLILSGEKKEEKKEDKEEHYYREVSYGSFKRMIPLNGEVDVDKVEATFKKGVLRVTLPKVPGSEKEKGKKIPIKS